MLGFDVCKITQVLVLVTITKSCLHMRTRQNVVCYTEGGFCPSLCQGGFVLPRRKRGVLS